MIIVEATITVDHVIVLALINIIKVMKIIRSSTSRGKVISVAHTTLASIHNGDMTLRWRTANSTVVTYWARILSPLNFRGLRQVRTISIMSIDSKKITLAPPHVNLNTWVIQVKDQLPAEKTLPDTTTRRKALAKLSIRLSNTL